MLVALVAGFAALACGCIGLPSVEGRTTTTALADTSGTRLGQAIAADVAAHPGGTGIHPMPNPHDAFAARVLLAAAAERSLDLQYFVWEGDQVGYLMFESVWQAAERGVRVRLLLDDFYTRGLDRTIAVLAAHRNIEVRLYNPFSLRSARGFNLVTDFARLNRRMHNKSFTVDNQVSVVGGRNIGNEYFASGSGIAFADLDVIAAGAAIQDVSKQFDLYWNSPSAYPAASIVGAAAPEDVANLQARFASTHSDPGSVAYLNAVSETRVVRDMVDHKLDFEWVKARLLYDDPVKTVDPGAGPEILLLPELVRAIGPAEKSFDLVTPYFVPAESGTAALTALAGRGVKVRIVTNSLASTDVKAVYSGYARRRKDLLRVGIILYELKPTLVQESHEHSLPWVGTGSLSALHAKTFAVDRNRCFVGSFNFDPRSALINTEMGLVIDSPILAQRVAETFDNVVPLIAYEVRLSSDGQRLQWIERTASGETLYDSEPETSWLSRLTVDLLGTLPIESLL